MWVDVCVWVDVGGGEIWLANDVSKLGTMVLL